MVRAARHRVRVGKGGVVHVRDPLLAEGAEAEVIILIEATAEPPPLTAFLGTGRGCFASVAEVDAFIRSERDASERPGTLTS